ncbi:hypothetical protein A2U01_0002111 [Trifolium medium]|uniref:Uncharacterized protein n=1 Tax=Trifolium medium TaxID=97028 RepID=A0A392M229_9FABA|nr:hypothetical protein [Trifolium medium]
MEFPVGKGVLFKEVGLNMIFQGNQLTDGATKLRRSEMIISTMSVQLVELMIEDGWCGSFDSEGKVTCKNVSTPTLMVYLSYEGSNYDIGSPALMMRMRTFNAIQVAMVVAIPTVLNVLEQGWFSNILPREFDDNKT